MKKLLLILATIAVMVSCKTQNIYLISFSDKCYEAEVVRDTVSLPENRFEKQFQYADSLFNEKYKRRLNNGKLLR